jgi:hypothetical protein
MGTLAKQALTVLFLSIVVPSLVHADSYVIPVLKKMKNVVTVAKSGGQYKDINTAIDSIVDAGPDNPYLIYIGPGLYTVTSPIQLKAYVTVMGSGREATLLKGAISTTQLISSAVILGADNATIAQLSVENTGGGHYSLGIYNYYSSPAMTDITIVASGGDYCYGVNNTFSLPVMTGVKATASVGTENNGVYNNYSSPTMTDVTTVASGGDYCYGVKNMFSSPAMTDVKAMASNGTYNYGVSNYYSSSVMTNVTAIASGGTTNRGVYINASSAVLMTGVMATASGGDTNYGVHIVAPGPTIRNCTLKGTDGTSYGVFGEGTTVLSTVIGGGGGNAVCRSCFDESGKAVDLSCN